MRSRKREEQHADVLAAHLSSACCHLGNISYRLGEQVSGTNKPDVFGKHEEIGKSWEMINRTVKGTLGLDLKKSTYQLGPTLTFDPEKERFVGNRRANRLLTRRYRKPFVVPKEV